MCYKDSHILPFLYIHITIFKPYNVSTFVFLFDLKKI